MESRRVQPASRSGEPVVLRRQPLPSARCLPLILLPLALTLLPKSLGSPPLGAANASPTPEQGGAAPKPLPFSAENPATRQGPNLPLPIPQASASPLEAAGKLLPASEAAAATESPLCQPGICGEGTKTRSGFCVSQLFKAYDDVYRSQWPGRVDLLVRTHLHGDLFQQEYLWHSIDLMWPKNIGDLVIVLDDEFHHHLHTSFLPPRAKVFFEKNPLDLLKSIQNQWSYFWADNYTTAPFIAIIRDENIFICKVIPSLLFNLTEGKPYMLTIAYTLGKERHYHFWKGAVKYFLGLEHNWGNFMVQQPMLFPREVLPSFRQHVAQQHGKSFDRSMAWWSQNGHPLYKHMIFQSVIGNYIRSFLPEKVYLVQENSNHVPIPRVAADMSQRRSLLNLTQRLVEGGRRFNLMEYQIQYTKVADAYTAEALCAPFPPGEGPCHNVHPLEEDKALWTHTPAWEDWEQLFATPTQGAARVYGKYLRELHCLYKELTRKCKEGAGQAVLSTACLQQ